MKRLILALLAVAWLAPSAAHAASKLIAEQVTLANAAKDLFGGTDAVGGVDDWYLSNGKVQAIIDDIGTVTTSSGAAVDKTSSEAIETGGTLMDLGLKGKNNDQLGNVFNVGGLSLANVFIFHQGDEAQWADPKVPGAPMPNGNPCVSVGASEPTCSTDADCASITVYGIMMGTCKPEPCKSGHCDPTGQVCTTSADCPSIDFCSTRTNPTLPVRTTYKVCGTERAIHMSTEVWNKSGNTQTLPVLDVFLWGGKSLLPFATGRGLGFTHPVLDYHNMDHVVAAVTTAPFLAAPGTLSKADGPMSRGKSAGTVSYGYYVNESRVDSNGPVSGGTITNVSGIGSLHSTELSAATILPMLTGALKVPNLASVVFNRTMVVGLKNDVASVLGDTPSNKDGMFANSDLKNLLGTVKGKFNKPAPTQEGTITFIRTGGPDLAVASDNPSYSVLNSAVMSEVRTKGSFKALLPEGTYTLRAVFAGRPDLGPPAAPTFTVEVGKTVVIPPITLESPGILHVEVQDATGATSVGMPAKISLSPSPRIHREFAAFTYSLLTGMCSNNFSTQCTADSTCGGGNTCFRTCANVPPERCGAGDTCPSGFVCASDNYCRKNGCSSDADCGAGYLCRADTVDEQPEGYAGSTAQMHVIFTDSKGIANVEVKPDTYTVSVSRGPKYTIQKFEGVAITTGTTTNLNSGSPVTLKRVVDTSGYMSADFHIHSGRSFDSSVPLNARVNSFASEGVEVMIATDHAVNTDYTPIIKKLKMTPFITSIIGTEITTSVLRPPYMSNEWGHINTWPSVYDPTARRSGAIEEENIAANEIFYRMRHQSLLICSGGKNNGMACALDSDCKGGGACKDIGEHMVHLNHPRSGPSAATNQGMLGNVGYDPSKDITDCQKYPVLCSNSQCAGGTNDGTSCTSDSDCKGGGRCGCPGNSTPTAANGCNNILNDMNTIPQAAPLCTSPGCGSYENADDIRNIDFDIMEIDNGGRASSFDETRQVRRDWLSILNQGIQVGAPGKRHMLWVSGVSDSHRLVMELPGYSRTYVGAGNLPNPASVDTKTFNDTIISGNVTPTTGPFISFTADDGGTNTKKMGETLGPSVSSVNLHVKVQAAPWVPVDEVRIVKNGCVWQCYNTTTDPAVSDNPADPLEQTDSHATRFQADIPDTITGDSYYIVEAGQNLPSPGDTPTVDPVVNTVAAGAFMFGVANPIFVDYDGGGYEGIDLTAGHGEPSCDPPPASCSAGAGTIASIPSSTMFARATAPQPEPSILARVLNTLVGRAVADEPQPSKPQGEEQVQPRQDPLRPKNRHIPWAHIEFPTPVPTPAPEGSGH